METDKLAWGLLVESIKRIERKVDDLSSEVSTLKGEIKGRKGLVRTIWVACSASAALGILLISIANLHLALIGGVLYALAHLL